MDLDRNEAAALSRMFSAAVLRQLGRHAASPLLARLVKLTRLVEHTENTYTVEATFIDAFNLLRCSNRRDDYVYRSAFVLKRMLRRHNLRTATMLNEVRAGIRKADLVVLNGTSTAYEIKSDRDSLSRLSEQMQAYRKVFASVVVLTGRKNLDRVIELVTDDVGVMELTSNYTLRDIRKAQDQPWRVDPVKILDILRLPEAGAVLQNLGYEIPGVPNTLMRTEMARIYSTLDPTMVHHQMVRVLRTSRSQAHLLRFVESLPDSLRTCSLTMKPDPPAQDRILSAVRTPLTEALTWK